MANKPIRNNAEALDCLDRLLNYTERYRYNLRRHDQYAGFETGRKYMATAVNWEAKADAAEAALRAYLEGNQP
jgi:hypothetical protein